MEEADELCNRLAIIDRGRLLALGPPSELKRSTGADTVVTVSATGDLDALAKVLETDVPGAQQATRVDSTVVVEVQAQSGVLPLVFGAAERHGYDVSDLSVTEPTLETVFINLTGKDLRE
jgi:ABC-2 type transport system ATP-binding protein